MKDLTTRRGMGLLMLAGVAVAVAGCASTPPATPSAIGAQRATADAAPTSLATPPPTDDRIPSASEPAGDGSDELAPNAIAQVVTTDLVVRSLPEVSDASVIHDTYLDQPTLLFVVDGPVSADGYDWYQVKPFGMHYLEFMQGPPPFGWVAAASRDGERWIAEASLDCPRPHLDAVLPLSAVARLACYGRQELAMTGTFGGCFVADPAVVAPEWLTSTGCQLLPADDRWRGVVPNPGGLAMRMNGSVGIPHDRPHALMTVSGHFDDPAAAECALHDGLDPSLVVGAPDDPAEVILDCRTQFVVTRIELVGP